MIYADYNSTSPLSPGVYEAMQPFLQDDFGNPSSIGYSIGQNARQAIEDAREQLAQLLGAEPKQVIFLSGATESCFHAILGAFINGKQKDNTKRIWKNRLITSSVEHAAVVDSLSFLERLKACQISSIAVDREGALDLAALDASLNEGADLISLMFANNESGVIFPLSEIVNKAAKHNVLVHSDAVQAVGKIPVDFSNLGVDFLSISAHKFGGPKGVGALVVRDQDRWSPIISGGGQEKGRRGGTEAVALIVGFGKAAQNRYQQLNQGLSSKLRGLREQFEHLLLSTISACRVNAALAERLPNTSNVCIEGIVASQLVSALDRRGVMISAGSACNTHKLEPSRVLREMGFSVLECLSSLRISFGPENTSAQVLELVRILKDEVSLARNRDSAEMQRLLRVA